jgi:hypothetical protein
MSRIEKFDFLFPPMTLGYLLASFVIALGSAYSVRPNWRDMILVASWGFGVVELPWGFYFLRRRRQIRESIDRNERRRILNQGLDPVIVSSQWSKRVG